MTILLLEKSKEVERRTQELAALQKSIQEQWEWYTYCGKRWGWSCRECKRVLPLVRADEARVSPLQASLKSAQDSLSFLLSRANAISQSLSTLPPSKTQASIKVINAIDSLRQYLQSLR